MYTIEQSGKFKKDFKKYVHDKEKLIALNEVIKHLEETGEVPNKFYPHPLKGEYNGAMECHIQSDFLLIWVDKILKQSSSLDWAAIQSYSDNRRVRGRSNRPSDTNRNFLIFLRNDNYFITCHPLVKSVE